MSELVQITDAEKITLELFEVLGGDPAAVSMAKDFVGSSELNLRLFKMSLGEAEADSVDMLSSGGKYDWVVISKKATQLAKNKLTVF